jgi:hypothetical protein
MPGMNCLSSAILTATVILGPGKLDPNSWSSLLEEAKLARDKRDSRWKSLPPPHSTIVTAGRSAAASCQSSTGRAARQGNSRSLRPLFHEHIVLETQAPSSCPEGAGCKATSRSTPASDAFTGEDWG